MASINSTTNTTNSTKVAYSYLQSKNKISGLVSGMDVDSIMEKLMKAESAQMEKLQQQKQKYEWKRDAYREVNTKLQKFSDDAFDNYSLTKNWNIRSVSNSSPSSVNVTASTSANGNLNITSATKAIAAQAVSGDNGYTASSTIANLGLTLDASGKGSFDLASIGADGKLSNVATIDYTSSDTLQSLADKINSSKAGVTAMVANGKFSLTANNTGRASDSSSDIAISGDGEALFSKLSFTTGGSSNFGLATGVNATAIINGVTLKSNTNKFSVAGYTLEFTNNVSSEVNISSSADTNAAIEKVKSFVSSYNDLVKTLNGKITEKRNIAYEPLTDAQKAEMNDTDITKWEEAAKSGTLRNDSVIQGALSEMRSTIYSTDANKDTLAKIGITTISPLATTSTNKDDGQLQIDEEKLKAALEKDPDILTKVFTGDTGVISKMRDAAKSAITNIKNVAGSEASASDKTYSIGLDISSLTDKISDWKDRLKDIEDRYWNQFSAMETAIQKANSQSSIFSS